MTTLLDIPQEILGTIFKLISHSCGSSWESQRSRAAFYAAHPHIRNSEAVNAQLQHFYLGVKSGAQAVEDLVYGWPRNALHLRKLSIHSEVSAGRFQDWPEPLLSFLRKATVSAAASSLLAGLEEVKLNGWQLQMQGVHLVASTLAGTCPHISSLELMSCRLSQSLLAVSGLGSRLTSLTINNCSSWSEGQPRAGNALVNCIASLPLLKILSISLNDYWDCDVEHHAPLLDISPLAGLGSLRNLTLRAWETSCAQGIMRNPARLHGLHKVLFAGIQLEYLHLGKASMKLLLQTAPTVPPSHVPTCPSLQHLCLPAVSLRDLQQLLHSAPNLMVVDLGRLELPRISSADDIAATASSLHQVLERMQGAGLGPFQAQTYCTPAAAPKHQRLSLAYFPLEGRLTHAAELLSSLAARATPQSAPLQSIRHLTIHRWVISKPEDARALANAVPHLSSLCLVRCDLAGAPPYPLGHLQEQPCVLSALLPQLPCLQHLELQLGTLAEGDLMHALAETERVRAAAEGDSVSLQVSIEVTKLPKGLDYQGDNEDADWGLRIIKEEGRVRVVADLGHAKLCLTAFGTFDMGDDYEFADWCRLEEIDSASVDSDYESFDDGFVGDPFLSDHDLDGPDWQHYQLSEVGQLGSSEDTLE